MDKEITERDPILALLPNRSEEKEIGSNDETRGGIDKISVRRSNRKFKAPERLGSVPYFFTLFEKNGDLIQ